MNKPNNRQIYESVEEIIEKNKSLSDSKKNSVFVLAIYKKDDKSESKLLINGFTLEEIDVVLREIYSRVYALRKRSDKKMQKINNQLTP